MTKIRKQKVELHADTSGALVESLENKVAPTHARVATMVIDVDVQTHGLAELDFAAIRASVANMMFEVARQLSGMQALEVRRSMWLVETGSPLASVPRAVLQRAMYFNRYPLARKLVEQKALAQERVLSGRSAID